MSSPQVTRVSEPGRNPPLYQVNTRAWLAGLSNDLGRAATLDEVPDTVLDGLAETGFDLVYFLGVWQTGAAGRAVSRSNPEWREEFRRVLPDLSEDDICGSCFAVTGYEVSAAPTEAPPEPGYPHAVGSEIRPTSHGMESVSVVPRGRAAEITRIVQVLKVHKRIRASLSSPCLP